MEIRLNHKGTVARIRRLLWEEARGIPTGKLAIRQLDRIHAITGVPWLKVRREARKEGLY
ncbi:MAG: hypothetical protein JW884_14140 [Deltaproteobacteria bacterium]|nr:hypothetical protein [Deltaproteobacteria bacterium]